MATTRTSPAITEPLLHRLNEARARTDGLFDLIAPGAFYDRPIPERHRLAFYLGHLEAFDWNLLNDWAFHQERPNAELDKLFAFGIDPTDGALPNDQPSDWPREDHIREYQRTTRNRIDEALLDSRSNRDLPPLLANGTLLHVAIEHRLMHEETLAYLLHQLPYDRKIRPQFSEANALPSRGAAITNHLVRIPTGQATLGQSRNALRNNGEPSFEFGWDNEFEENMVDVPEFAIAQFPVTNGEFLEFMRAGGYKDPRLWNAADWDWKTENGLDHPFFWVRRGHEWLYRGMFEEYPLPVANPVYVSYAEASAYARWAGMALPTEAQWHRAAYGTASGPERLYPWGNTQPNAKLGNFDFSHWDPQPVTAHPAGASSFGVHDLLGNGWEWTSTTFGAFPGFEAFPFYPGYSANFFDGLHFVMKGGSARTAECFLRRPYRNWFQPRYPYVYAKFRCAEE